MKTRFTFPNCYRICSSFLRKLHPAIGFCALLTLYTSITMAQEVALAQTSARTAAAAFFQPVPAVCYGGQPQNAIFYENFEAGLGAWAVSNYGDLDGDFEWAPRDWTVSSVLPDGRAGKAAYAINPGEYDEDDNSIEDGPGVMTLTSPAIKIPSAATGAFYLAFEHFFDLKARFDGGNIQYQINDGSWTLVPASAFSENGYNLSIDWSEFSYSALYLQPVFSGPDDSGQGSGWGQSRVDLGSLGLLAGQTIRLRWNMGTDQGVNGRKGWYVDDVRVYTCAGLPTVQFATASTLVSEGAATIARPEPDACLKYVEKIVTVKINAAPSQPVTITLNALSSSTATLGKTADYNFTPGSFTLQAGKLSQDVRVRIYNDAYVEGNETAVLGYTMSSPAGGNAFRETYNQQHTLLITDDDFAPGIIPKQLISEDFDEPDLGGWKILTEGGYGTNWVQFLSPEYSMNNTPFLWANLTWGDDPSVLLDKTVESPPFDSFGMSSISLSYNEWFDAYESTEDIQDRAMIEVWDGSQWQTVLTQNSSTKDHFGIRTVSIPAAYANRSMKVRFHIIAGFTGWAIDDVKISGIITSRAETAVTATPDAEYLGPNATAYFYDPNSKNLIARIKNLSNHDYGCTSVSVNRAGSNQTDWYGAYDITRKTFKVTPDNDNPDGQYEVTLYYLPSELAGFNTAIKSMGRSKTAIEAGNNDSNSAAEAVTSSPLNASLAFTSVFRSGFSGSSGFGLSDAPPARNATLRINSGGESFAASASRVFSADQFFTGTAKISVATGDITATTDDELYRSQRVGAPFSYSIPVQNGQISVVLHFAEIYWGVPGKGGLAGAGKRRFHVNMEGSRKLTDYDIFAKAGGAMRARTETFQVTVTDGVLNLDFLKGAADNPALAAIEILSGQAILAPAADATVRNTPNNTMNYGAATTLEVKTGSLPSYQRGTYLKFPLAGISQVGSAKLRLYGQNVQNTASIGLAAFGVTDDSWTETGITWSNAPAGSGAALGSVNVNNTARYYEIDVTAYVKAQLAADKIVSLFVTNPANQNIQLTFNSKENAANPPQLVITAAAPPAARTGQAEDLVFSEIKAEPQPSSIYPNPTNQQFTVDVSAGHEGKVDLRLVNMDGNVIQQINPAEKGSKVEVKLSSRQLPEGIYLINIRSNTFGETLKVIIKK